LSLNDIEGALPPEIGNLTKLRDLSLYGNSFSGAIPKELGRLTGLNYLLLSYNAFRGAIPSEIKSMTGLIDNASDFNFNALSTTDATVRDFVNRKQSEGGWEKTQTITPSNPRVTGTTDRSATVEWDAIPYDGDEGGFQVVATTAPGGAPVGIATTASK